MTPPVATRPELRRPAWVLVLPLALAALLGWTALRAPKASSSASPLTDLPLAVAGLIFYAIVLLAAFLCVRASPNPRATLGIVRPSNWGTAFRLAVGLVVAGLVLGQLLDRVLHASKAQGLSGALAHGTEASIAIAVSFVAFAIVGPVVEELVFRGLVTSAIRGHLGSVAAPLVSGTLFALAHGDPHIVLALIPLGIALSFVYERTGSVLPGTLTHMLYNAIGVIVVLW